MEYVKKLNKSFSRLGFGGAALSGEGGGYGFGELSESDAIELVSYALEKGINTFDFAPIYGFGLAEKRAGLALRNHREKVHLISKSGVSWHDNGRVNMSNDPKLALKMLDQSLKNFDSDYIDIYLIHWPDPKVDIRAPLEALYTQKEKGKILHLGLCNTTKEDLAKAKEVAPIEVIQMEANLFHQEAFADLEDSMSKEVYRMGWGTYDKGILSGSVTKERRFENSDCRSWAPWWKKGNWKKKVDFANSSCRELEIDLNELARLAFSFSLELVDTSLCGAKSAAHINSNLERLKNKAKVERVSDVFASF